MFSGCSAVGSVPGLGPGCRRFESCHPDFHLKTTFPKSIRGVAQLVAFLVWDQAVAGSSPVTPTKIHQFTRLMDFSFFCNKSISINNMSYSISSSMT